MIKNQNYSDKKTNLFLENLDKKPNLAIPYIDSNTPKL